VHFRITRAESAKEHVGEALMALLIRRESRGGRSVEPPELRDVAPQRKARRARSETCNELRSELTGRAVCAADRKHAKECSSAHPPRHRVKKSHYAECTGMRLITNARDRPEERRCYHRSALQRDGRARISRLGAFRTPCAAGNVSESEEPLRKQRRRPPVGSVNEIPKLPARGSDLFVDA